MFVPTPDSLIRYLDESFGNIIVNSAGYCPPPKGNCSFQIDTPMPPNAVSVGGAYLSDHIIMGRVDDDAWVDWTNQSPDPVTVTVTQLGEKIPAQMIWTIDGDETVLDFGPSATELTFEVPADGVVEGVASACWF